MKTIEIQEDSSRIEFSNFELSVLAKIIIEVANALTREFVARVGASIAEALQVEDLLTQAIDRESEFIELNLSRLELGIIHSCLNEVCHGFNLADFESKLGASREEVSAIFKQAIAVTREMRSILEQQKAAFLAEAKLNKQEFFLKGDGYQISFYLSKKIFRIEEIGIFLILFVDT